MPNFIAVGQTVYEKGLSTLPNICYAKVNIPTLLPYRPIKTDQFPTKDVVPCYKSSAISETGDRGQRDIDQKEGGAAVPLSQGAGTPSNTMWPGPWYTSAPSGIFIHPAVWPHWHGPKLGGCGCVLI